MTKKSERLDETRWSLWVDSRHRITIPKDLMAVIDWQVGDTLVFTARADGSVQGRSLDRDLRVRLVELEGLRNSSKGSPKATRVDELTLEIAELIDRLYPLDTSSPHAALAQQAFAETQTRQHLRKKKVTDGVDAILASMAARKAAYRVVQDLKRMPKKRAQR